jgi:hypothetical protein
VSGFFFCVYLCVCGARGWWRLIVVHRMKIFILLFCWIVVSWIFIPHLSIFCFIKIRCQQKNVKNIFLSMCDVKVSDIYFTEFGVALTTVLPVLFKYCYFKAPTLSPFITAQSSGCHYSSMYNNTWTKQVKQLSKQRQTQWSKCQTLLRHTLIKKYFWHFLLTPYLYKTENTEMWNKYPWDNDPLFKYCYTYCYSDSRNFEP